MIGIGVLSFAHGHASAYCSEIVSFEDARLVAGWDDDEARGRLQAARFGMSFAPRLDDVLGAAEIQAVIITSETSRHAELCELAAAAEKDILLQKPMALSLAECDRIARAVNTHGVRFSMAFQMRCDPVNCKIRELVRAGAIGKVFLLRRRHCLNVLWNEAFREGKTAWHVNRAQNYGMFFDDAVHATDFVRFVLGDAKSVMAEIHNHAFPPELPEDSGVAIYRMGNGATAELTNNSITRAAENTTEIYGDQGTIIQNHGDAVSTLIDGITAPVPLKIWTVATGRWEQLDFAIPRNQGERIAGVARPFIDWLHGRREAIGTLEDGHKSVEMVLAAYESSREGRRVDF